jgi:Uma2 family endonuclease
MVVGAHRADFRVAIPGVDPRRYRALVNELGTPDHRYHQGLLELPDVIANVPWRAYKRLLKALGDRHLPHTYDKGTLELMSPQKSHEWVKRLISRFIETMAWDLRIPIQSIGSTTITSDLAERGFEADESYYIANEPRVRGKLSFEPDVDPPPDLLIEVDVTSKSKSKFDLFSAMRVPEVWCHDGKSLTFLVRKRTGGYRKAKTSLAFPFLRPGDIQQLVERYGEMSENALVSEFVEWARKRRKQEAS